MLHDRFRALPAITIATSAAFAGIGRAQDSPSIGWPAETPATRQLTEVNDRLVTAYLHEDVATLHRLLDEAHVHNNVFGMALTKDQFLGDIESGTLVFDAYRTERIAWHVDGNTAVATGLIQARARRDGRRVPATRFLFTRVFVRREGQWKVLLFHNTMVPDPSAAR
jgi:ketosteroid isomerase-like protein